VLDVDGARWVVADSPGATGCRPRTDHGPAHPPSAVGLGRAADDSYPGRLVMAAETKALSANRPPRLVVTTTIPNNAHDFMRGQLNWLARQGLEVHLVSSPGALLDATGEREGVSTHPLPMRRYIAPAADLLAFWRWLMLLRRLRPDVVACGTPKAGLLAGVASTVLRVPRRVYVLRGLRYEGARGIRREVLRILERASCAAAHVVVAVSPSLALAAVRSGVVPADKVVMLGHGSSNGVDPGTFRPPTWKERSAARSAAGVPPNAVVVGFVGRLTPDKGLDCLESAFECLSVRNPDVWLLLVGEQDSPPSPAADRLLAHPRVRALGFVADPLRRYAAQDVLCLPTRREGFPNVVLEAAACGIPAVTTRATGAIDSVVDGETGLTVPVDDPASLCEALELLYGNPGLRAYLGDRARQRALRDFEPQAIWEGILRVYLPDRNARGPDAVVHCGEPFSAPSS
jgi:glycosyltransferase involved in cell wall biosynthesis